MGRTIAIGVIGASLALGACGGSERGSPPPSSSENAFALGEFTIIPPTNELHVGAVSLTANNVGAELHELVIVRASSVDALPKKADGSLDEDKTPNADKVGEIGEVPARSRKSATFDLTAGTYVAFCNLIDNMIGTSSSMMHDSGMEPDSGHVHFARGMHVTFAVR